MILLKLLGVAILVCVVLFLVVPPTPDPWKRL